MRVRRATTIAGSADLGVQVGPDEMDPIDLIVSGSVAVADRDDRVGKGEGYSDLEFGLLREFGLVDDDATVVTTVHGIQIAGESIPTTPRDLVVTPERRIRTDAPAEKPSGIAWSELDEERIAEIPVLQRLR